MTRNKKQKGMETFPMWKLPPLTRKLVFQQMDKRDLIDLSMTSRPVKRLLTAYKTHTIQLTWDFNQTKDAKSLESFGKELARLLSAYMTVTLTFDNDDEDQNLLFCILENHGVKQDYERTINGVRAPLAMRKRKKRMLFEIAGGEDREVDLKFMEDLTEHIKSIFYIDTYNVSYDLISNFDFFGAFFWKYSGKKFGKLDISPPSDVEFNEDQIRMIFNELEVDDLCLEIESDCELIQGLNLNSKKLKIWNTGYLSIEDVQESKCEKIEITFPGRLNVDRYLIKTINLWKTGKKLSNLKRLKFKRGGWSEEEHEEDKKAFFEKAGNLGIRRHESAKNKCYINRDTDKAVALLAYNGDIFKMIVQNDNDEAEEKDDDDSDDSDEEEESEDEEE